MKHCIKFPIPTSSQQDDPSRSPISKILELEGEVEEIAVVYS